MSESQVTQLTTVFAQFTIQPHPAPYLHASFEEEPLPASKEVHVVHETLLDAIGPKPSPLLSMVEETNSLRKKRASFLRHINAAYLKETPAHDLLENFQTIFSPFAGEPGYASLLNTLHVLLEQSAQYTQPQCRSLRLILEGVFIDGPLRGGLTLLEGSALSSQLLYLRKEPLSNTTLSSLQEDAMTKTRAKLEALQARYLQKIEELKAIGIYNFQSLRCTLIPLAIAQTLVLPNGELNLGMADQVQDLFLATKDQRDSVEKHISTTLKKLRSDSSLQKAIEAIPSPPQGLYGTRIINNALMRPHDTPVTAYDTHQVCLATCLTYWRQHCLGSCVLDSLLSEKQISGLRWLIDDMKELLFLGYMTRYYRGIPEMFLGLEVPETVALYNKITDVRSLRGSRLEACIKENAQLDNPQWNAVLAKNPKTMHELLQKIKALFPGTLREEECDRIRLLIESPTQSPLLRVIENTLGSTLCPPFSPYSQTSWEVPFTTMRRIFNCFNKIALRFGLDALIKKIQEFHSFLEKPLLQVGKPSGSALTPIEHLRLQWIPSPFPFLYAGREIPGAFAFFFQEEDRLRPLSRREFQQLLFQSFDALFAEVYEKKPLPKGILPETFLPSVGLEIFGAYVIEHHGIHDILPVFSKHYPRSPNNHTSPIDSTKRGFLLWLRGLRQSQEQGEDLSFRATTATHSFRLLPNDPSFSKFPLFSFKDELLALDSSTRAVIEQSFQQIPAETVNDIVSYFVEQCSHEVWIHFQDAHVKTSFQGKLLAQLKADVLDAIKEQSLSFSLLDYTNTIPSIIRDAISTAVRKGVPHAFIVTHKPHEWIRDHLQLSDSVDNLLHDLYSHATNLPPHASLFRISDDPLVRQETLLAQCIQTPLKDIPSFDQDLPKFYSLINFLVQQGCREVTLRLHTIHKKVCFTFSEIDAIHKGVLQILRPELENQESTIDEIIATFDTALHTELARKIQARFWGPLTQTIRRLPQRTLIDNMQISLSPSDLHYLLITRFAESCPQYQNLLIHFADSNFGITLSEKLLAIHYCFWFDPFVNTWAIVSATETGQFYEGAKAENLSLGDITLTESPQPVLDEARRTSLLVQQRKCIKKSQQLERTFADALMAVEQHADDVDFESLLEGKEDPMAGAPVALEHATPLTRARALLAMEPPHNLPSSVERCLAIIATHAELRNSPH